MEVKVARDQNKGFMGRTLYVTTITAIFTDEERAFFKKNKRFMLFSCEQDDLPAFDNYDEVPLQYFLEGPFKFETGDADLNTAVERTILNHFKELKDKYDREGKFSGTQSTYKFDDGPDF